MGNSAAILSQYYEKIYNLAYRMTGNKDDAGDITQETFIQAIQSLEKFKGESQIYTWLFRIAKNNSFRHLEKRKKTTFLSLHELSEKVSSQVSEEISEKEKQNYILQVKEGCLSGLIRCLSLRQRLAFILNIILDVPISDVALIIDKSENATRILVHRARQNIKSYLCTNCSLYNSKNVCRCENLINFSLKQKWIDQEIIMEMSNQIMEEEIRDLKREIGLVKSIGEKVPAIELSSKILQLLNERKDFLILNEKKVK